MNWQSPILAICLVFFGAGCNLRTEEAQTLNEESVLGVDNDGNGIRDDVQNAIRTKYQSEKLQFALNQNAKALREYLRPYTDLAAAKVSGENVARAAECLGFIAEPQIAQEATDWLETEMLDTQERNLAYFRTQAKIGATMYSLPDNLSTACDFDVSKE